MLKKIIGKSRGTFLAYLILAPLSSLGSILFALSLEPIVTAAIKMDGRLLLHAVLWCLLAAIFEEILYLACQRKKICFVYHGEQILREELCRGLVSQSIYQFKKKDTAWYLNMFHNDVEKIRTSYISGLCGLYQCLWSFLFSICTVSLLNGWITLFIVLTGIVSVVLPKLYEKRLFQAQEEQTKAADHHMSFLKDILNGFWIIKGHRIERYKEDEYQEIGQHLMKTNITNGFLPFLVGWISANITTIAFIGVIALGAYFVILGKMEVGIVLSLSQLIGGILVAFENIPAHMASIKGSQKIRDKMEPFLDWKEREAVTMESLQWKRIEYRDICFSYENQEPIFRHLNFVLEKGKKYAVLGKSGSGKSTLAKVLAGIYPANEDVFVDGQKVQDSFLREKCAYMSQDVFLFKDTVFHNVTLYRKDSRERVRDLLRRLGFAESFDLQAEVGENGSEISGGERQRIGLARELLDRKEILILDEFTANLDPLTSEQIEDLVLGLHDTTCVFITHKQDSKLVKCCDRVIYLENSTLI